MNTLSDFFSSSSDVISKMASNLHDYKMQYDNREISLGEYNDLVEDALVIKEVDKAGKTLDELVMIDKVISILKELASVVPIP